MEAFNFVIFGFTSNLAQLKIIPALYDLEEKNLLSDGTKIVGVGRKDIDPKSYVAQVLNTPNRHHQHPIDLKIQERLVNKCIYLKENMEDNTGQLYESLQKFSGNTLFYLATYPELYNGIFENLKKFNLNVGRDGWVKIMIEKPIGNNFDSACKLNLLLGSYFDQENIFRVDHYLGKEDLQKIFNEEISPENVDNIQLSVLEDFGIGKRGVYYDATGALVDMGQNHFMQLLASVAKDKLTVQSRENVIKSLIPESDNIILGQYEGYLEEENVKTNSKTDTFFALKTHLSEGKWKDIPIYMRSGKKLSKNEVRVSVVYTGGQVKTWIIESKGAGNVYDPYEKLITEAVSGNQFYFNSAAEVEYSWKFIDSLNSVNIALYIYKIDTFGPHQSDELIRKDGRIWV